MTRQNKKTCFLFCYNIESMENDLALTPPRVWNSMSYGVVDMKWLYVVVVLCGGC